MPALPTRRHARPESLRHIRPIRRVPRNTVVTVATVAAIATGWGLASSPEAAPFAGATDLTAARHALPSSDGAVLESASDAARAAAPASRSLPRSAASSSAPTRVVTAAAATTSSTSTSAGTGATDAQRQGQLEKARERKAQRRAERKAQRLAERRAERLAERRAQRQAQRQAERRAAKAKKHKTPGDVTMTAGARGSRAARASITPAQWRRSAHARMIVWRESNGRCGVVSSNGLWRGTWQMTVGLWRGNGGLKYASTPDRASCAEQDVVAYRIWVANWWHPWGG